MASLESTIAGRVFLISTPRVGSSRARTTSPRRTPSTLLLILQDGPRLGVAHVPIAQQISLFFSFLRAALHVVGAIRLGHLAAFNRVEVRGEHPREDPAAPRLRDQGVRARAVLRGQAHVHRLRARGARARVPGSAATSGSRRSRARRAHGAGTRSRLRIAAARPTSGLQLLELLLTILITPGPVKPGRRVGRWRSAGAISRRPTAATWR